MIHILVIPAKAGIQRAKVIPCCLDTGFRRYDGVSYRSNANATGMRYEFQPDALDSRFHGNDEIEHFFACCLIGIKRNNAPYVTRKRRYYCNRL